MNIVNKEYQQVLSNAFSKHYKDDSDVWTDHIEARIIPFLIKGQIRFNSQSNVLDIGCGQGNDLEVYSPIVNRVDGVDLFRHNYWDSVSNEFSNVNFHYGDFLSINLPSTYNLIVDNGCFHHQHHSNWQAYLNKIRKIIADDGDFVVSTFADENTLTYQDENNRIHHYLTDNELEEIMHKYDFTIVNNIFIYRPKFDNYLRVSFCKPI
jgi:cyclopropane fatty-acyl-phospholipid synthase-like methyltransferase